MRKYRKPKEPRPTDPKKQAAFDRNRYQEKTHLWRLRNDVILPEFVENWRLMIFKAWKKHGLAAAEQQHAYCVGFFADAKKSGDLTAGEAKGIIENFDSFIGAIRKMDAGKRRPKV